MIFKNNVSTCMPYSMNNNRYMIHINIILPLYRPLAVGVAQHFRSAILEYNSPCIVIEAYECFDAYSLCGLQMYMLFQYMITQAVLYKITEQKY